jgi:ABC-type lipoprotein export system ATPase subunit
MMPMHLSNCEHKKERGLELLDMVGLSSKKNSRLHQLSGGEQQRIAIAIALSNSPKVLLADEPTGSVDRKTAEVVFDIFKRLNREINQTIIIVTHDVSLSKKVQRVAAIRDGKISSERILKESYSEQIKNVHIDWQAEETQEEYAIIDRSGRIQIPKEMLDSMGISGYKVKVELQNGKIIVEKP